MEEAFSADFSDVRIHQGDSAGSLGALAYTIGSDVHFAPGEYDPHSERGLAVLGHELTHVVQQRQGRVAATMQAKGLDVNDDPVLEAEADRLGERAARGEPIDMGDAPASARSNPVAQGLFRLKPEATKLALGRALGTIQISDDGTLAVPPGNGSKKFYATEDRIEESNRALAEVESKYTIRRGEPVTLKNICGQEVLTFEAVGEHRDNHTKGKRLSGPVNCDGMAEAVVGNEQTRETESGISYESTAPMGLDLATSVIARTKDEDVRTAVDASREGRRKALPKAQIMEHRSLFTVTASKKVKKQMQAARKTPESGCFAGLRQALTGRPSKASRPKSNDLCEYLTENLPRAKDKRTEDPFIFITPPHQPTSDGKYTLRSRNAEAAREVLARGQEKDLIDEYDEEETEVGCDRYDTSELESFDQEIINELEELDPTARKKAVRELGLNEHARPGIGQAYGIFPVGGEGEGGFPYHWAGVVAKAGEDTVTFENFYGPDRGQHDVFFAMYGPYSKTKVSPQGGISTRKTTEEEKQSRLFHNKWKGSFDVAITATFGKKIHPDESDEEESHESSLSAGDRREGGDIDDTEEED
jgi:hypothetical protein